MSKPIRPNGPEVPEVVNGTKQELRREGHAFGVRYDLAVRITNLSDPDEEIHGPPLLPEAGPLALPPGEPREATRPAAPEGIGRWESEGGQ